ncbi:MAG: hypothetical protein [Caudoviricetes sp.]|nr:MAG: hypothetical protein [Caudoviricetes sp.]
MMSPVGNPELWKSNQGAISARKSYNDFADTFNSALAANPANFGKGGKLKRGVKYRKHLSRAETDDLYSLPVGQGYVGGRFRANWQFSVGSPENSSLNERDASGAATMSRLTEQILAQSGGYVGWLTNNVIYSIALEYGHSSQAPDGMVGVTLARVRRIVEEAVAESGL